jgi:hypothetical protein
MASRLMAHEDEVGGIDAYVIGRDAALRGLHSERNSSPRLGLGELRLHYGRIYDGS